MEVHPAGINRQSHIPDGDLLFPTKSDKEGRAMVDIGLVNLHFL